MISNYNRRTFIKRLIQTGSTLALSSAIPSGKMLFGQTPVETPADLVVVKGELTKRISTAFDMLGGTKEFVKPNSTVLLKPNASFPNPPAYGSTTNPQFVKIVAEQILAAGAKRVIVLDHTMRDSESCFKRTGLQEALADLSAVKLISLENESHYEEVPVNGEALKSVLVAKLIAKSDLLINLPCAKSHVATDVSFGLKNLMGLIWDRTYFHESTDLHKAIAELAKVIRPQLTLLDATRVLATNGPTGPGQVLQLDTIIAGTDPLAVDSYAVSLANWNNGSHSPKTIKHLALAGQLGVGRIEMEKLIIKKMEL
jgi:uncharacterized protein (DUF362 family)